MATLSYLHRLSSRRLAAFNLAYPFLIVSAKGFDYTMSNNQHTRSTSPNFNPSEEKLIYPAASRNQVHILKVWQDQVPKFIPWNTSATCLEIASGSGQHIAHFAPFFPNITFQPSDCSAEVMTSIGIYAKQCPTGNIKQPILMDIMDGFGAHGFEENSLDLVYCCNMIQVAPYECAISLFTNAGLYLKSGGIMITYGPYALNGIITPQSNVDFDASLKTRDPRWGIRCLSKLEDLGKEHHLKLMSKFDLPANNKCIIWQKE